MDPTDHAFDEIGIIDIVIRPLAEMRQGEGCAVGLDMSDLLPVEAVGGDNLACREVGEERVVLQCWRVAVAVTDDVVGGDLQAAMSRHRCGMSERGAGRIDDDRVRIA